MKALAVFALVVAVVVGGFFAVVVLVIGRGDDDQSALTREVDLVLSNVEESRDSTTGTEYRFDLAYEVDGQWYGTDDDLDADYWDPSLDLTACVNPQEPREFVVNLRSNRCGQESITGGAIQEAEPTSRPADAG